MRGTPHRPRAARTPISPIPVEPLDPDSPDGRRIARALTELILDIDERLAREATQTQLRDTA